MIKQGLKDLFTCLGSRNNFAIGVKLEKESEFLLMGL